MYKGRNTMSPSTFTSCVESREGGDSHSAYRFMNLSSDLWDRRLPHLTSIGMTLVNNIHVILIYMPVRCAGG